MSDEPAPNGTESRSEEPDKNAERAVPTLVAMAVRRPHPILWTILYLPFGGLGGFVQIAMTFMGNRSGIDIGEVALLTASSLVMQWLKWIWAPLVDTTLTPRRWYLISTVFSAIGIIALSAIPLSEKTLPLVCGIIMVTNFFNSIVGMAVEAIIAGTIGHDDIGKVSGWLQVGNLSGASYGGALALWMMGNLIYPWLSGAILGGVFLACCAGLIFTPDVPTPNRGGGPIVAIKQVGRDFWKVVRLKGGLLAAILCALPVGTGAAQTVLAQGKVAEQWHADADAVALTQGLLAGTLTAVGCLVGGYICQKIPARIAYALMGLLLALVAALMGVFPLTVRDYIVFSVVYGFVVGLCYSAFSAFVLQAISNKGSGATSYNVFASLSNFPLWWLGIVLAQVAKYWGPRALLLVEAAVGAVGVGVFAISTVLVGRSKLATE